MNQNFREETYFYTYFLIFILIVCYFVSLFFDVSMYKTHTSYVFSPQFYTLLTALFFHGSLMHLVSNLLGLFVFGRNIEKHLGVGVLLVFLGGGVIANLISNLVADSLGASYFSLGASSGIASLVILSVLLHPFRISTFFGWFLIYSDVIGLFQESQTNHLAHLSGYFALLILYLFFELKYKNKVKKGFLINLVLLVSLYLIVQFLKTLHVL